MVQILIENSIIFFIEPFLYYSFSQSLYSYLVDGNALNISFILALQIVNCQEASISLILYVDALSDENRVIVFLPKNIWFWSS